MGTNYYFHEQPDCECCGRPFEEIHIGKSSGGWCFSLHVIPEMGINTLADWEKLWTKEGSYIKDEYGRIISIENMREIITERRWRGEFPQRHQIDGIHCIGHGDGTWDYVLGEFS